MNRFKYLIRLTVILTIGMLFIAGCSSAIEVSMPPIKDIKELGPNQTIVVGRFVLEPPLEITKYKGRSIDYVMLGTYEKYPPKDKRTLSYSNILYNDIKGQSYFGGKIEQFMFVKSTNRSFYIVGCNFGRIELPARFRVNISPDDKAIYIGTVIYYRDEFNGLKDIKIKNEYKKAKKAFQKKFGKSLKLRKSLLVPIE